LNGRLADAYVVVIDLLVGELDEEMVGAHAEPPADRSVPRPRGAHHRLARSGRQSPFGRSGSHRLNHLTATSSLPDRAGAAGACAGGADEGPTGAGDSTILDCTSPLSNSTAGAPGPRHGSRLAPQSVGARAGGLLWVLHGRLAPRRRDRHHRGRLCPRSPPRPQPPPRLRALAARLHPASTSITTTTRS
jgi:hypothetical protein